ncbi:hypothetical protein BGZ92_004624 [Podila epicladia]|nr:hypothetical protein BGZ92_004624 [Podila epicladia]
MVVKGSSFHKPSFQFKLIQVSRSCQTESTFRLQETAMSAKIFENNFFKNIPLSTFKGLPKENVQDWLSELDKYLGAVNATSTQKFAVARLLMRDNARRWLKLCPATPETADP